MLALLMLLAACSDARRFTPEGWRQADPLDRHVYVGDLISRHLLIGKPRREVERLLGPGYKEGGSTSWNVGVNDQTGKAQVLQVDFSGDVAVRATLRGR
jgi:hypothetical protein